MRFLGTTVAAASIMLMSSGAMAIAAGHEDGGVKKAMFNDDGSVQRPAAEDYRRWVFIGTPLTPNALNGGEAPFPEFHAVYIEPGAYDHYAETGEFPNGTQIVKELTSVREGDACDEENGSCSEVSGQGYFMGEFIGLELTVKDTERFPDEPGGWVYYSFGHVPPEELADSAQAFPAEACNACHEAAAADDFVFTQFYPVLRAVDPK